MQDACPYCKRPLEVTVRKPGGESMFVTGREWLGRIVRPRRYEQTVTPPAINITQAQAPAGPLNPGETVWRTLDERADIRPQVRMGLTCAGYVVCLGACIAAGMRWPVMRPVVVIFGLGDVVAAAVFLRLNWDVIVRGDDGRLVTRKREPETQPVIEPQPWHVKAEYQEGRKTLYDDFDITDAPSWHQFCKAVHFEGKNFSETEAKRHGVPLSDWATVSTQWADRGWLIPAKRRGTPVLMAVGKHWVRAYATTPPQAKAR